MKNRISLMLALLLMTSWLQAQTITPEEQSNSLTDVWDFGAAQLNETIYNNWLTADIINGWYTDVAPGTITNTAIPGSNPRIIEAGSLKLLIKGTGDRTYATTETQLSSCGEKYVPKMIDGVTLNGALFFNAVGSATARCIQITAAENDEISIYLASTSAESSILHFDFTTDAGKQAEQADISQAGNLVKFVAKAAGAYSIYITGAKGVIYRVERKEAAFVNVSGAINTNNAADIPSAYGIVFTNNTTGKAYPATINSENYNVSVPQGYTYTLSLSDANGYIISNVSEITVNETVTQNIEVLKVTLNKVTGVINGLDGLLGKVSLVFTPETEKVYVPKPVINAGNGEYSVQLEPNCKYIISAEGVNDYTLINSEITITEDKNVYDLTFETKLKYTVTINAEGLTAEQQGELKATLTNLIEEGYSYAFNTLSDIKLRDGVYSVALSGLDSYPLQQALTSNLKVDGETVSKNVTFKPVTDWTFDDVSITGGATHYKGLAFTGSVRNEMAKGHLLASPDATVVIPINKGEKVIVTYYYSASFTINGGDVITTNASTGSTSKTESAEYTYAGTESGTVILLFGGDKTTYIKSIKIARIIPYAETINVGNDKEYKTINAALEAVSQMPRPNNERIKIRIEPGNYEEMLVINTPNISLINAATTPSIALKDKGVNIDNNAVRITSYYGHGYNYYSMGNNQKWNEEILKVNKENGYASYANAGSGTTNGSYWNATVVVSANGFEAENIIFENSYNQYISGKESEDVVKEWAVGGKGTRPTAIGNTAVQNKSFVERAAAIAITNNTDKIIFKNCRVIGRQDSFYGGTGVRAVIYKGSVMGGTDYIFGGMTTVFYKSLLAMNTSEDSNDVSYITAAQQSSGRGYLMYECTVTSAEPETETASVYRSKPGYFGRPWQANTAEVIYYNTTIETSNNPGYNGKSLIVPAGWNNSLGGTSPLCYEYGTIEKATDATPARVDWATQLTEPKLSDGTEINTLNFTKGTDGWDPIPALIEQDPTDICQPAVKESALTIFSDGSTVSISGIQSEAIISIYSVKGCLSKTYITAENVNMQLASGLWIVKASNAEGVKAAKVSIK